MKGRFIIAMLLLIPALASAQYATKRVSKKQAAYTDSIKSVEYDYIFPIWGQKAYKRGFDLPYPVGLMGNFLWIDQGILIDNMQLGLKTDNQDIPLTPVDFIQFGENRTEAYTANFRPDVWIFPFLNLYGIIGGGTSITTVRLTEPVELKSVVEQKITTYGIGVMGAFGIGPVWLSVDANSTWTKPVLLEKPVRVRVLGVRVGKTWTSKSHPERNFAIWIGGMRARMESETRGEVSLQDALPPETWDRADEIVQNYTDWYNSLNPNNPIDAAKQQVADQVLTPIVERIGNADGSSIIRYGMDKAPAEEWNMVVGAQYQFNKRWMLRSEGGVLGDRKSFLLSINYRLLL